MLPTTGGFQNSECKTRRSQYDSPGEAVSPQAVCEKGFSFFLLGHLSPFTDSTPNSASERIKRAQGHFKVRLLES